MSSRFTLFALVASSAAIWALVLAANERQVPDGFFQPLSYVVGVLSVVLLAFERHTWRWAPFKWLVRRPDLRGTWQGTLTSDYRGGTGPIEVYMVVRQTFSTLSMRLLTKESESITTAASMYSDSDERISIFNVYLNRPKIEHQERSRTHRGALQLDVVDLDGTVLNGEYWTDRGTTGSLQLRLVSRKAAAGWQDARALVTAASPSVTTKPRHEDEVPHDMETKRDAEHHDRSFDGLADMLAEAVDDAERAKTFVIRAGFPPVHIPEFRTPQAFWTSVVRQAAHGRGKGLRGLICEAVEQFPGNDGFRAYADRLETDACSAQR